MLRLAALAFIAVAALWGCFSPPSPVSTAIASATVHKGFITFTNGGTVKIRILPGRGSYTGSTCNGVTSEDWDEWDGSFEFVTD